MIFRPAYVERIMLYTDAPFVKVLSGVRRSGKSTILKMIAEKLRERGIADKRIVTYNFDSLERDEIKTAKRFYDDAKLFLSKDERTYLFLDEVQEVED